MSAGNGESIIKIGPKGRKKVRFSDDDTGPVIQVDVIAVNTAWAEIDRSFRDEKGVMPAEKVPECNRAAWDFVRQIIVNSAKPNEQAEAKAVADNLDLAQAMQFLAEMTKEGMALRRFFEIKSPDAPPSRESTDVIFST